MRKPVAAAFGTRAVSQPITVARAPIAKPKKPRNSEPSTRYGMIIKIAVVLWAVMVLAVIFWR